LRATSNIADDCIFIVAPGQVVLAARRSNGQWRPEMLCAP